MSRLMDSADIYDSNFPCNDADEDTVRAWAHNGRQIMYSVYFDETIEDMIYVFVNVDDDICEYHVKYDELRGNDVNPPKARFKRFKGPHLTAPAGYKVLHPFMSVDSAMRTYNYLVVNLEGPIDVKMITYRLHSSGENKPLRWEKYDISNDLITRFQHQKFYGSEGTGQKYDYHTLDFLRNYDFRVDQGGCPQNLNALMSTFDCVNFISAHYHGYEVYALAGRSARKMPCQPPAHPLYHGISRNAMFLETGHCKNSKVRI
uniref:Uncharacterized protein n=1 Tax=Panagrolaimus sp. JU765 TaxID=591449 RepID=A0AC34Q009_9BILA